MDRVLRVREKDYVLCGDNRWRKETGVTDRHVIGVLTAVVRDGKELSVKDRRYRLYVLLWCGLFPLRALLLKSLRVMKRAAKLCGLDTALSDAAINDALCEFADYRSIASWAKAEMAFCYAGELLDTSALNAEPKKEILRGEVAEMLYRMLVKANLI